MSQNMQNPFSTWMDMNKNIFDTWSTWASSQGAAAESANPFSGYFDYFNKSVKSFSQNPIFSSILSGDNSDMLEQMNRQWQETMKNLSTFIPNKSIKEGFDRFLDSYQMYNGLQNYWETFLKNMPKDMQDWNAFAKPAMQHYQNLSSTFLPAFLPEQLKGMFTMPVENLTAMQQSFLHFFKPWVEDSTAMQGLLLKALQGDKDAYMEFLKSWTEVYKNSLAKLLNMPTVGANRASVEKMMKLLDYYVNFVFHFNEYNVLISGLLSGAMEKLMRHLAELQAEGKQPQTFMEFYKLWSKFNEQAFVDMYNTDEFSVIMNETVSAGSKLQILFDDFMQDVLAFLPLPNRRELDDVEEEVYTLRKRVKALEKELQLLKDKAPAKN